MPRASSRAEASPRGLRLLGGLCAAASCALGCAAPPTPAPPPAAPAEEPSRSAIVCAPDDGLAPRDLACTGLYADWRRLTVAPDAHGYRPAFELWSDGAQKTRWIHLPAGTRIDNADPDDWVFPVGTKAWKEFRVEVDGRPRRVETRLLWKVSSDEWIRAVYAWSPDEASATLLERGGAAPAAAGYTIPPQTSCIQCHSGKLDMVLGFEAVLLAAPEAEGFTLAELGRRELLTKSAGAPAIPGTPVERRALGILHANCGVSCHHRRAPGAHFDLRLEVGDLRAVTAIRAVSTTVNQPSQLRLDAAMPVPMPLYRVRPADPDRSSVLLTMRLRDPADGAWHAQMPPIASRVVDVESTRAVEAWIRAMTPAAGYPPPAP